jgi:hypothetical protein
MVPTTIVAIATSAIGDASYRRLAPGATGVRSDDWRDVSRADSRDVPATPFWASLQFPVTGLVVNDTGITCTAVPPIRESLSLPVDDQPDLSRSSRISLEIARRPFRGQESVLRRRIFGNAGTKKPLEKRRFQTGCGLTPPQKPRRSRKTA